MDRSELIQQFYILTETEQYRRLHPDAGPSSYYQFLEKHGYLQKNGVYHIPSIYFAYRDSREPETLWDCMDMSPYQSLFRIKKATRFSKEPLMYADFLCIRYVYSGEVQIETPATAFTLRKNDILLMNAGFVLSQHLQHEEDIVFTLMFEKEYLVRNVLNHKAGKNMISGFIYSYVLNSRNAKNYIIFHGEDNDKLPRLIEDIVMEYIQPTELGTILLEAYLQILLVEMMHGKYEYEQTRESKHSFMLARIMNEIELNYQTVNLKSLADKYHYSPDYISRQIKNLTGKNFKDYLLARRMEQVCMLLRNSELSVSEIQMRVGLQNETYFYKKFRELYGQTPGEYRAKQFSDG
ncbi:MAG: AraC family transcriptional regulator [Oscillospiraceae bacterium]|nr:AraC family transcriptional regulator [Oscillospiraceae bacterium]